MTNSFQTEQSSRIHGGTDAQGTPKFDFSTNSNACGPCPIAQLAVKDADATHYPDASYTTLREQLAAFHGVEPWRIVVAGSASAFIFRITALASQNGVTSVDVPKHSFGDYAHAAKAWGLTQTPQAEQAGLIWHCQPSSPLGQDDSAWVNFESGQAVDASSAGSSGAIRVLDLAYAPLQLTGGRPASQQSMSGHVGYKDKVWQLWSPNKALGLTGVRAAYAIAPVGAVDEVNQLALLCPSWPIGAHGVALLSAWVSADVQAWLQSSLHTLQVWKTRQIALCESLGWTCWPSETHFFCATPRLPIGLSLEQALGVLRQQGIKLRDTASFGLPGQVRLSVQPPLAQDALYSAWLHMIEESE